MKVFYRLISLSLSVLLLLILVQSLQAQTQEDEQVYVIQAGDSLWKIATKYLGDGHLYPRIIEATKAQATLDDDIQAIVDPRLIFVGQRIWIPMAVETSTIASPESVTEPETPAIVSPKLTTEPETSAQIEGPSTAPKTEISQSDVESTRFTNSVAAPVSQPATPVTVPNDLSGHIAFSFWNNHANRCTYEINLVNVAGCLAGAAQCQATRRIFTLNNVSEPALSPDGQRLAFRGWGEPPSESSPYLQCAAAHPHRYVGNAALDGSTFRGTGGFWEDSHPDWSPDGNQLLFDTKRHGDDVSRILFIGVNGTDEQNPLIAGQQPSWAPDSHRFVYRGCDLTGNRCGLWTALAVPMLSWNTGQNMLGPVLEEPEAAHPDWSPVAEEIVYQSPVKGSWDIYRLNVDGSDKVRLTTSLGVEGLPAWSPDGQWVAYIAFDGLAWRLRAVSRDGSIDRQIFVYDGGGYRVPYAAEPYGVRDWVDEQISWGP